MRRLARHSCPYLLTISSSSSAECIRTCEKEKTNQHRLKKRDDSQPSNERSVAEVNGTRIAFSDWLVLSIERAHEFLQLRRLERHPARQIRRVGGRSL